MFGRRVLISGGFNTSMVRARTTRAKTSYAKRVRGRVGKPLVVASLERHSHKKKGTKTGLSGKGISVARRKGPSYPKGLKAKGYSSPVSRAAASLNLGQTYARRRGRKIYKATRIRRELGFDCIKDMPALEAMIEKAGIEEPVLRRWLDGKISKKVIAPAKEVADSIIRKRLGFGNVVLKLGGKDILLRNVSHSWLVEAVFERLTGRKFQATKPTGTMVRPTEGLTVAFTKGGRAILSYRQKRYDVSANLNRIAGKARIERIVARAKAMQFAE